MRIKSIAVLAVATAVAFAATPAAAQTREAPPSEPSDGVVAPEPAMQLWIGNVIVRNGGDESRGAPAGSPVDLVVSIHNGTDKAVSDITLKVSQPPANARVIDGTASVESIAAQKSADVTLKVEMSEDGCEDFAGFGATLTSSLGTGETKFGFPVLCPGPRLHTENVRYRGGDGDQVVEPGERLEVFVTVRNTGRDAATDVRGTVTLGAGDVKLIEGTASWPDIAPEKTAENSTPFVIEVAGDAKEQEGCSWMGGKDIMIAPEPGGEGGTPGSTEPAGSGGGTSSDGENASSEEAPDQTVSSDDPQTMIAPAPEPSTDDGREPAPIEAGVGYDAQLKLSASERTFDAGFGSQMVCAMAEMGGPEGRPALKTGGDDAQTRDLAGAPAGSTSSDERSGAIAIAAVLLLAAGSVLARYRFTH